MSARCTGAPLIGFLIVTGLGQAVPVTLTANLEDKAFTVSGAGCAPGAYTTPPTLQWTPDPVAQ